MTGNVLLVNSLDRTRQPDTTQDKRSTLFLPVLEVATLHHAVADGQPRGCQHPLIRSEVVFVSPVWRFRHRCVGLISISAEESHQDHYAPMTLRLIFKLKDDIKDWNNEATQGGHDGVPYPLSRSPSRILLGRVVCLHRSTTFSREDRPRSLQRHSNAPWANVSPTHASPTHVTLLVHTSTCRAAMFPSPLPHRFRHGLARSQPLENASTSPPLCGV